VQHIAGLIDSTSTISRIVSRSHVLRLEPMGKQRRKTNRLRMGALPPRYSFVLNPNVRDRFTKCPSCEPRLGFENSAVRSRRTVAARRDSFFCRERVSPPVMLRRERPAGVFDIRVEASQLGTS